MTSFAELGLGDRLTRAVEELGYVTPTPVQENIIPKLLDNDCTCDIVCLAQTGTGKTAAFGLPLLEKTDCRDTSTQALVLAPTRELAKQIAQDLENYARHMEGITIVPVYGGAQIEAQCRILRKGAQIIVATPGRLIDLIGRKAADISCIKTIVLDEADEMLNMGFKEELDTILESAPAERRTLLFSATLPIEVEKIAKTYMKEPEMVTVGTRNSSSKNVKHYYFVVHSKDRYLALKRIVDYNPDIYGIIFCRTRQETQDISDSLIRDGYDADALHGDLSQSQRDMVMKRFRQKALKLLVATDVAARGIDVNCLTHVINYNLPDDTEQYTHRSGRTGRADKTGVSYAIINPKEKHKIKQIEKLTGTTFAKAKIPNGNEVCSRQILHLIGEIDKVEVRKDIEEFIPLIEEKWASLSREEIIRKVISIEFNRFIDYYRDAPDLNAEDNSRTKKDREPEGPKKDEKGCTWVRFNTGTKFDITPRHMLRLIASCGVGKKGIGKIDMRKDVIYVSVASKAAEFIVQQLNGINYRGRKLKVELLRRKEG